MDGCVSSAMEAIESLYPQLFEQNPDLLFMLKCRQFIEMLAGSDSEASCFIMDFTLLDSFTFFCLLFALGPQNV